MKKCLIIGATMLDIVMKINALPNKSEDIYAKSQEMTLGGCAYNVASIINKFDVEYTLFAPIGKGIYADIINNLLQKRGLSSTLYTDEIDNGYCLCLVEDDGERTFITLPGIECNFKKEWFDKINPSEYDSVYISGYEIEGEGGENIIEFLENNPHLTIYYAPGPRINHIPKEKNNRIFKLNPIIHLNKLEALTFTNKTNYIDASLDLYKNTKNTVFVTLGEDGVYVCNDNSMLVPTKKAKVVDTIGAGDSNIGTIIAMLKLGYNIEKSVTIANKISSMIVETKGPTLDGCFDKEALFNE